MQSETHPSSIPMMSTAAMCEIIKQKVAKSLALEDVSPAEFSVIIFETMLIHDKAVDFAEFVGDNFCKRDAALIAESIEDILKLYARAKSDHEAIRDKSLAENKMNNYAVAVSSIKFTEVATKDLKKNLRKWKATAARDEEAA